MKLLIVGDATGEFLKGFAENLLNINPNIIIDVLNTNENSFTNEEAKQINSYNKVFTYSHNIGFLKHIPKVRGLLREFLILIENYKINTHYDVVLLFGIWPKTIQFLNYNFKKFTYIVGAIMGSDFLRRNERKNYSGWISTISKCDRIIVGNPQLLDLIKSELLLDSSKVKLAYYGSLVMENLSIMKESKVEAKKLLKLNVDKLLICCGYNAKKTQQHIKFIEQISNLNHLKDKILLVYPLTYGQELNYLNNLKELISKSGFESVIFENFMSVRDVALLRKATDIFVHIQETDAFSGSMQENLYLGNIVVNGSWLPYDELKKRGVKYIEIDDLNDLSNILDGIVQNYSEYKMQFSVNNTPDMYRTAFWANNIETWHEILTMKP